MPQQQGLANLLEFPENGTIALIGGGGKTTLLYCLGQELAKNGKRVIGGTTTHIMPPSREQGIYLINPDEDETKKALDIYGFFVAAGTDDTGKLCKPKGDYFRQCKPYTDYIILEADGAKKKPIKVPAEHEPVVPEDCDVIIGVIGVDAFGGKIQQVSHRAKLTAEMIGLPDCYSLTVKHIAEIVLSKFGYQKSVTKEGQFRLVINKCDNLQLQEEARLIALAIRKAGGTFPILMTALDYDYWVAV